MNRKGFSLALLIAVLVSTGCDSSAPPEESDHVLDSYQHALDKARGVEDDVLEAAERQRKAIEEQEGG